jgi:hypothetical protein
MLNTSKVLIAAGVILLANVILFGVFGETKPTENDCETIRPSQSRQHPSDINHSQFVPISQPDKSIAN